jgi:hypothetical protein
VRPLCLVHPLRPTQHSRYTLLASMSQELGKKLETQPRDVGDEKRIGLGVVAVVELPMHAARKFLLQPGLGSKLRLGWATPRLSREVASRHSASASATSALDIWPRHHDFKRRPPRTRSRSVGCFEYLMVCCMSCWRIERTASKTGQRREESRARSSRKMT